jgi:hypothetical protein
MGDTNYLGSVVKILEKPVPTMAREKFFKSECRAQLSQVRNTKIVHLVFWGNLARDAINSYQLNDYLMIEGYISLRKKTTEKSVKGNLTKIEVAVLKAFPF